MKKQPQQIKLNWARSLECYGIFSMVIPLDNHNLSVLLRSHENVIVIKKTSSGAKYFSFSDCLSYSLTRSQHVVVLIIDL